MSTTAMQRRGASRTYLSNSLPPFRIVLWQLSLVSCTLLDEERKMNPRDYGFVREEVADFILRETSFNPEKVPCL